MNDEKKLYGASILEVDERKANEEDGEKIFEDIRSSYTDNDIAKMRDELKDVGESGSVDKVYTDSITGIKSSEKVDPKRAKFTENFRKITMAGTELIKSVTGEDADKDDIDRISAYFKDKVNSESDILTMETYQMKNVLGEKISGAIHELAEANNVDENEALGKFLLQIYSSYVKLESYNDDVDDVFNYTINVLNKVDIGDENTSNSDLKAQYDSMGKVLDRLKNLDERNSRLKPEYGIDDFDILTMENLKDDLETALNFTRMYSKLDNPKKLKKESKDKDMMVKKVKSWISDLKTDPDTLYVFPINDYMNGNESVIALIDYIKSFILLQDKKEDYDKISDMWIEKAEEIKSEINSIDSIEQYMVKKGYVSNDELKSYENSAILFLYILSRTFKLKKIKTDDDRRILSYTLDMICKLDNITYSKTIMEFINKMNIDILGIKEYSYIS